MRTNCAIYQIVHKPSGKRYIGSSINIKMRKSQQYVRFKDEVIPHNTHLYSGGLRLPIKDVHYGIIEYFSNTFSVAKLRKREMYWINLIPAELCLNKQKKFTAKPNKSYTKPTQTRRIA